MINTLNSHLPSQTFPTISIFSFLFYTNSVYVIRRIDFNFTAYKFPTSTNDWSSTYINKLRQKKDYRISTKKFFSKYTFQINIRVQWAYARQSSENLEKIFPCNLLDSIQFSRKQLSKNNWRNRKISQNFNKNAVIKRS